MICGLYDLLTHLTSRLFVLLVYYSNQAQMMACLQKDKRRFSLSTVKIAIFDLTSL